MVPESEVLYRGVMDWEYVERVMSIVRGRHGWHDEYSSISELKHHLDEAELVQEKLYDGWVFWRENERVQQQQQIITLLQNIASSFWFLGQYLVQYWGVEKVEGRNHYLSTSNRPFCVGELSKGNCWYRKLCSDHVYVVDVGDDHEQQLIGGVGWAYRNKHPESTPDLRLYSTSEFPLRNEAAGCGFIYYRALPLFDFHTNQCYGVLELLSHHTTMRIDLLSSLDGALQIAGFRPTHSVVSISDFTKKTDSVSPRYKQHQHESEIREILELAMKTVPRLYLAQVWVPCKQCCWGNIINTNLCCMEMTSFIYSKNKIVDSLVSVDADMFDYLLACELHNLQIDLSCLDSNFGGHVSISKNPLAHYLQRARMFHPSAIYLQSMKESNHFYVLQFFLRPRFTKDDACGNYSLHLMEMSLKSFKFVSGGRLVSEPQNPNANKCESNVMKSYMQKLSYSNFTAYLEMVDSSCLILISEGTRKGWGFWKDTNSDSSLLDPIPIEEKVKDFMKNIAVESWERSKWIVQFWSPKMMEDRCYLEALDQPYVVGCLAKVLASFRKKCMTHYYFVDDEAKEEELGPPGRVFRNGHPEFTPDLFHYSTKEFHIRDYAMHCCSQGGYFALPIFDADDIHNQKCLGVLEFVGFFHLDLEHVGRALKASKLSSTHIDMHPRFLANEQPLNTIYCRKKALTEICNALKLMNIPQLHLARVWVSNGDCVTSFNSNMSCMELALSTDNLGEFIPKNRVRWIHIQTRKGMVGMVLASENKSCFCRTLCEFSIADQPLSHFEIRDRRDVCFAIGWQSSQTGDLVYVVEFFLYQGPATYEYLRSFLNFLLPIMKHELKSFKMASGKEIGEELVVDVIEFTDANKLDSSEAEEADVFPIKFKSVQYSQKEHQHSEAQQKEECSVAVETEERQTKECNVGMEQRTEEEQQIEQCSVAASGSKIGERGGKGKTSLNLSVEVLMSHFGKKLEDVAQELGIGKSTIKRACRGFGIDRWPTKEKYKKNPSLFQGESGRVYQQDKNTQSTHHVNVEVEAEKVMIKVKYEEDIVKFELCLSLGLAKLIEEVSTRMNLEKGAFKLKYSDEDGDDILLTNDADLQLCRKTQIAMNKTYIQLFVR